MIMADTQQLKAVIVRDVMKIRLQRPFLDFEPDPAFAQKLFDILEVRVAR